MLVQKEFLSIPIYLKNKLLKQKKLPLKRQLFQDLRSVSSKQYLFLHMIRKILHNVSMQR